SLVQIGQNPDRQKELIVRIHTNSSLLSYLKNGYFNNVIYHRTLPSTPLAHYQHLSERKNVPTTYILKVFLTEAKYKRRTDQKQKVQTKQPIYQTIKLKLNHNR